MNVALNLIIMSIQKVIIGFGASKVDDAKLVNESRTRSSKMRANPVYQTLEPDLTALDATCDNFESLVERAKDRTITVVAEKNSARIDLENLLASIGLKVQDLSKGDDLVILNSGYKLRRKSEPVGMLPRPENVIAVPGIRIGTIDVSWNVVPGSFMYEVQFCLEPPTENTVWQYLTCSKHYVTIENLPKKATVYIRIAAAGADPRRVWSDVISGDCK